MKELFSNSYFLCLNQRYLFLTSFLGLVLLTILSGFPLQITELDSGSGYELLFNFIIGILELLITVNVINVVSAIIKNKSPEKLIYTVPAFFIGSLCYIFLTLFGFILFIIPGLWALFFLVFAPIAKILSPEENAFKKSKELVKKSPFLVAVFVLLSLAIEFLPIALDLIANWKLKSLLYVLISLPLAGLNIIFITAFVKLFYQLEAAPAAPKLQSLDISLS